MNNNNPATSEVPDTEHGRLTQAEPVPGLFDSYQLRNIFFLVASYVLSGKLSLLLAVPPGYASAIFPPAGIAIAAIFIGGWRLLPWVLLGSFILNLWIGPNLSVFAVLAALGIALASMLQAATGGWVFRKIIGYPTALDKGQDLLRFLMLGPVICLISATLSVGALTALGMMGTAEFAGNWLTWWVGDTLGLIIMFPLVMTLGGQPQELWRKRRFSVAVPMLLALVVIIFGYIRMGEAELQESLLPYRLQSQQLADQLQTQFEIQEYLLKNVDAYLSNSIDAPVTRTQFTRFVAQSLERFPVLQAVEWVPRITHERRAAFEAAQQAELPGFEILERGHDGKMQRASARIEYYPVTYVEPLNINRAAVGFDLTSTPERKATLERAMLSATPVATPPLRLVQETGEQSGVLLLYRLSSGRNAPGVVLTVLRISDFIDRTLPQSRAMYEISLTDVAANRLIYGEQWLGYSGIMFEQKLEYGGREYLLRTKPSALYWAQNRGMKGWFVLVMGLFGAGLLGALLLIPSGYTARVEKLVRERTAALTRSEQEMRLARDEAERANRVKSEFTSTVSHELRTPLTSINGALGLLAGGVVGELPPQAREIVEVAKKNSQRLNFLINDLLDVEKLMAGKLSFDLQAQALLPLVEQSLRDNQSYADQHKVSLDLVAQADALVMVDAQRILQVLANLISNAAKFAPERSAVKISVMRLDGIIRVEVKDSGPGIPEVFRDQIFQKFAQADSTDSRQRGGTGLGLAITRELIERMNGQIGFESVAGAGTTFFFELPVYLPKSIVGGSA